MLPAMAVFETRLGLVLGVSLAGCVIVTERPVDSAPPPPPEVAAPPVAAVPASTPSVVSAAPLPASGTAQPAPGAGATSSETTRAAGFVPEASTSTGGAPAAPPAAAPAPR